MAERPSHLCNANTYTGKTTSLCWISCRVIIRHNISLAYQSPPGCSKVGLMMEICYEYKVTTHMISKPLRTLTLWQTIMYTILLYWSKLSFIQSTLDTDNGEVYLVYHQNTSNTCMQIKSFIKQKCKQGIWKRNWLKQFSSQQCNYHQYMTITLSIPIYLSIKNIFVFHAALIHIFILYDMNWN